MMYESYYSPEQTIQMNCSLPQQASTQNAQLSFVRNGITAGSFRLNSIGTFQTNGVIGNTFVTVQLFNNDLPVTQNVSLANNNQTPPFVYTPQLRLINPTPTNITMTCNNIVVPTTSNVCRLVY